MDVSEENMIKLQTELYNVKKNVSGADQKVTELLKEMKDKDEMIKTLEGKAEGQDDKSREEYLRRSEVLDRKTRVLELALEKGIDPTEAISMLGLDGLLDEERLDMLVDIKTGIEDKAKLEYVLQNGRRVPHGLEPKKDNIFEYSDKEISAMPTKTFQDLQEKSKPVKKTLRQKLGGK